MTTIKERKKLQRCGCTECHGEHVQSRPTENLKFQKTGLLTEVQLNPLTPDSAKSKTDKFSKITNWVKLIKELLNSFPINGHTLGFSQ